MPAPTLARLIESASARLAAFPNALLDAELLFRGVSGLDRAALLTRGAEPVGEDVARAFEAVVARRERHEPVQYILGMAAFWRDEFVVNKAVLIPRPETELLVETVANHLRERPAPSLLDVGTGSGCVALSVLRELPNARALLVDLSEAALGVATSNSRLLGLDARSEFRLSRWFSAIGPTETFDAIASNPPYVAPADEGSLPRDVIDFEPALALFADEDDDLSSYRAIVGGSARHLCPGGLLAFEVGQGQAGRVADLLSTNGFVSIATRDDLAGVPRVVLGHRT
jgi:release factor glutamine methyltransferase